MIGPNAARRGARIVALALVALALGPAAAWAASPFIGRWAIESFGQADRLVFEFTSDTEMVIAMGDEKTSPQAYSFDPVSRRLTLPIADGSVIVMRYDLQGTEVFVLYMGEALLQEMVAAFTSSLPQDANALTNEIIEELKVAVREVFFRSPFMRGTRLE